MDLQLPTNRPEPVIVAHSLGCLATVHWAARYGRHIRGALLVGVPDPASPVFPRAAASGFAPLPFERLPFPTIVVSSNNDPYGTQQHARACAVVVSSSTT